MVKRLIIFRRVSQIVFLILFIYILWSTTYPLNGMLPADTFFKLNPLIMVVTSISERIVLPGIIFSILMIIFTIAFGRFFCGWVCPLGTSIDIAGSIRKNNASRKDIVNKNIAMPKFFVLGVVMLFSITGFQFAWILDPMVIMARFVSLSLIPTVTLGLDKFFVIIIKNFQLYGAVYDFYKTLKTSILGVNIYYFSNSGIIFLFFLFIVISALFLKRFWCRSICPLGALYALIAKAAVLRRVVYKCVECKKCNSNCRMGAIKDDLGYDKGECVLCMDCVYDCPQHKTVFTWRDPRIIDAGIKDRKEGMTRKNFLLLIAASSLYAMGFAKKSEGIYDPGIIRPPASLKEPHFLDRCVRCGNCMKVCITNGLQPVLLESGFSGIWTPQLVPEIGYCEYNCTLCGNVCPTGAIQRLSLYEKKRVRLGVAQVDRSTCLPWAQNKECIVCEEHCPISDKAIKLKEEVVGGKTILRPYVETALCVGCGICQNKCPVRPKRAVRVYPEYADRY